MTHDLGTHRRFPRLIVLMGGYVDDLYCVGHPHSDEGKWYCLIAQFEIRKSCCKPEVEPVRSERVR